LYIALGFHPALDFGGKVLRGPVRVDPLQAQGQQLAHLLVLVAVGRLVDNAGGRGGDQLVELVGAF
jgi:hypothetical protein